MHSEPGNWRLGSLALVALVALGGCDLGGEPAEEFGALRQGATVKDYEVGTCSTSVVVPLSVQVAQEVDCIEPGALVPFAEGGNIKFASSAVLPYLSQAAKNDLLAAAAGYNGTITINSGFRTVVQQYLLYRWYQLGRCGITAAATPGRSNHESGRALDIGNWSQVRTHMAAYNFHQTVPGDEVHFDHLGSPDNRGLDVLAFQRLWNRNHPGDLIAEDGEYGPQTAARLAAAPAGGFPIGACEGGGTSGDRYAAERGGAEVPAQIAAGERLVTWVELRNTGTETWTPETTFLGTTGPKDRDSLFFDEENWTSPNRPTPVDYVTRPGEVGRFSFVIRGPDLGSDRLVTETFGLVEEGVAWFGPEDVTLEIEVLGSGGGDKPDLPGEPGDVTGQEPMVGGCSSGGPAPWPVALLVLVGLAVRARRRLG